MKLLVFYDSYEKNRYWLETLGSALTKENASITKVALDGQPKVPQERMQWLEQTCKREHYDMVITSHRNALFAMALPAKIKKVLINPKLELEHGVDKLLNRVLLSDDEQKSLRHIRHLAIGGYIRNDRRHGTYAVFTPKDVDWNHSGRYLLKYDPKGIIGNWDINTSMDAFSADAVSAYVDNIKQFFEL